MRSTESLDSVVFRSLTGGTHSRLAQRRGRAVRYPVDVSGFAALPDQPQRRDWNDLAALAGTSGPVALTNHGAEPPESWTALSRFTVVQMIDDEVDARPDPDMLYLSGEDVPEMLQLVAQTKPGPFAPRTIDMGSYIGLRRAGRLVAMAGERFRPPGWTEISAVCTAPEFRGRGLATRLAQALAYGIRERGETPFLHVASSNTKAVALYEALGFTPRRTFEAVVVRPPNP